MRKIVLIAMLIEASCFGAENLVGSIFSLSNANSTTSMPWGMYFAAYDANNKPVAGNSGNVYYNVRLCLDYSLDPILNPSTQCTGGAVADLTANTAQSPSLSLAASGCTVSFSSCTGNWWQPVTIGAVNPNDGANHLIYAWSISKSAGTSSTTTLTVGTGTTTFTVPSGLTYSSGIHARATSGTGAYMEGVVSSYSGTSLVIAVDATSGTGSHNDWTITIGGYQLENSPQPYAWSASASTFTFGWQAATPPVSRVNAGSLGIVVNLQDSYFSTGTSGTQVCSCPASGQCGSSGAFANPIYDGASGGIAGYYVSQYGVPCTNLVAISISPNSTGITGANFASALGTINASFPANVQALALAWNQPSLVSATGSTNSFRAITGVVANGSAVNDPAAYSGNKCTANNSAGYLAQGTQNPMFNTTSATPFASYGFRPTMMLTGEGCNGSCSNNYSFLPNGGTVTSVTDNLDGTETLTLSTAQAGIATGFMRVNYQVDAGASHCAQFNGRRAVTVIDSTHIKLSGSGACTWTNTSGSLMQWYDDVATAKATVDSARAATGTNPGTGKVYLAYTSDLGRIVYATQVSSAMTGTFADGGHSANVSVLGTPASPINSTGAVTATGILFYGQASQHWTFSGSFLSGSGIASAITSSSGMTVMDGNQLNPNIWIKNGAVGAVGTFIEPCGLTISKYIDWQLFLHFYLNGSTVIEAMWKAARYPWDLNFVGNPLAAPFAVPLAPASQPSTLSNGIIGQ